MKILVVIENTDAPDSLTDMIKEETSHNVVGIAKEEMDGIYFMKEDVPDLVITDLRMDEADRNALFSRLQKNVGGVKRYSALSLTEGGRKRAKGEARARMSGNIYRNLFLWRIYLGRSIRSKEF